ncbi:uncharacterized protein LOC115877305 [Sitophilus oryzae]|uniref:Uncharacterized protein LOC115877305 n=1 Tax=Sitophilus oryzae TaxID=7048 RepID=A0A6J2XEV9_SITOR|nr:uncharacterized protein LOC115877305 [Sitophilus oryzae]
MVFLVYVFLVPFVRYTIGNSMLEECAKYYKPTNYLALLPNLKMPYIGDLAIPDNQHTNNYNNLQKINPSPVVTTKVLTLKTKYVYKNPVCIKTTKKRRYCAPEDAKKKQNVEKLVTKEYFVDVDALKKREDENDEEETFNLEVSFDNDVESSETGESPEEYRSLVTPQLAPHKINELLIEDRLAQLETILPQYQRRRVFETSTIFVTKTINNKRNMATLIAKNCIPLGYELCRNIKPQKRRSKLERGWY